MTKDYGGVVNELIAGEWKHPGTGQRVSLDIRSIVIKETLDGMEGELVYPLHKNEKIAVVSDRYTFEVLGRRIGSALRSAGFAIEEIILQSDADFLTNSTTGPRHGFMARKRAISAPETRRSGQGWSADISRMVRRAKPGAFS